VTEPAPLAIVIPAWKPDFLDEALGSLAGQTDRSFRVYVGDDAGPPAIGELCARYRAAGLALVYHRFPENLGGRSLPAQWNRCIALCTEPWIWLFGDDDRMEPGCVAALHRALSRAPTSDLLRFDTDIIDGEGGVIRECPPHPDEESGADFLLARLQGARESFATEYVVRRDAFQRAGGFPDFPAGWAADDAAWYRFAGERPIVKVPGCRVQWRASGRNITSRRDHLRREKLEGAARLVSLVLNEVRHRDPAGRAPSIWAGAAETWYRGQLRSLAPIPPALWPFVLTSSRHGWRAWPPRKLLELAWPHLVRSGRSGDSDQSRQGRTQAASGSSRR
jgi:glycosyltransferase involved in cell wall biosynthesis